MSYQWQPIETAPTDGSQDIFIAVIRNGRVLDIDFYASVEITSESWELPQEYSYWASEFGNIEEPTHWAPMPEMPGKEVAK